MHKSDYIIIKRMNIRKQPKHSAPANMHAQPLTFGVNGNNKGSIGQVLDIR